jgi:hypothetical protein
VTCPKYRFERIADAHSVGTKVSFPILVSISGEWKRSFGNVGNPDDPRVRKGRALATELDALDDRSAPESCRKMLILLSDAVMLFLKPGQESARKCPP